MATTPPPSYHPGHPLQFLVTNLDADPYVGRLAVGRLWQGEVRVGDRVGVAAVSLKEPIQPGATQEEPAIGTSAEPPVNGTVTCRALEPG